MTGLKNGQCLVFVQTPQVCYFGSKLDKMVPRDYSLSISTVQYITLQYSTAQYSTVHCKLQYITSLLGGLNADKQLKIAIFSKIRDGRHI